MIVLALASLLQAPAVPAPPPHQPDITVTAPEQKSVERLVLSLANAAEGHLQLARFEDRVCPGVVGMAPATAIGLVRLIRDNMTAAGAKLLPEECRPNAVVIFTAQPAKVADAVYERVRSAARMSAIRRRQLRTSDAAIRSFRVTEARTPAGVPLSLNEHGKPKVIRFTASRLTPEMRVDSLLALAFVDSGKAAGKTLRQLADITTMHLLLEVNDRPTAEPRDTILSLFTRGDAPAEMTAFDRGLLRGLYAHPSNAVFSDVQRARMAAAVRKEREASAAAE